MVFNLAQTVGVAVLVFFTLLVSPIAAETSELARQEGIIIPCVREMHGNDMVFMLEVDRKDLCEGDKSFNYIASECKKHTGHDLLPDNSPSLDAEGRCMLLWRLKGPCQDCDSVVNKCVLGPLQCSKEDAEEQVSSCPEAIEDPQTHDLKIKDTNIYYDRQTNRWVEKGKQKE